MKISGAVLAASGKERRPGAPVALLLHGFGSNAADLASIAPELAGELWWASLQAPLQLSPESYAWFQILTPGSPDPAAVAEASAAVWDWVDSQLPSAPPIVPIGFSQGGLMATELLRTRPTQVPAAVVLAGFVQSAQRAGDELLASERPPVFWGRGREDGVIAAQAIQRTADWLPSHARVTERIYPGLAHGINAVEVAEVRAFLTEHTDPDGELRR